MKKLLFTVSVAVLFLATGTVHAALQATPAGTKPSILANNWTGWGWLCDENISMAIPE